MLRYKYFYQCIVSIILPTHSSVRRIHGQLGVLRHVTGKSEQRAFFIPTQPSFDFTLGFACTQSSQTVPSAFNHNTQYFGIESIASSSLLGM
jgi:hypothetical protein